MKVTITFGPKSRKDLQQIYDWYEEQQINLGEQFLKSIDECTDKISITPTASSVRYKNVRCKPLQRFPYLVYYKYNETANIVIIYRILHTSRKPLWK